MWPNPQEIADLLKKSLMENFIFCAVQDKNVKKNYRIILPQNFRHFLNGQ